MVLSSVHINIVYSKTTMKLKIMGTFLPKDPGH
jgi:hypothetical protein